LNTLRLPEIMNGSEEEFMKIKQDKQDLFKKNLDETIKMQD